MKRSLLLQLVGGALIGLVLGYWRHLLVLSSKNQFPNQVLLIKASVAGLLLIPGIIFAVVGTKKRKKKDFIPMENEFQHKNCLLANSHLSQNLYRCTE
jgi:hypothetical protein